MSILHPSSTRRQRNRLVLRLLLALPLLAGFVFAAAPAQAQVSGNTWTSPNYGCAVSWDGTWFVSEETSEPGYDSLTITNGVTFLTLICEENTYSSLDLVIALMSGTWRVDPAISNFEPIVDATGADIRGGDAGRSFAAFSYTYTAEDGSFTGDFGVYFEARLVNDGKAVMEVIADMPIDFFFSEYQLAGVSLPGPAPEPAVPETVIGEPAPVFADGFWRVGIAAGARGVSLPGIGLEQKAGKEWFVAIADITNWSQSGHDLSVRDLRLVFDGVEKPVRVAPASTSAVGERLGFPALREDMTISIQPGQTVRLALVYSADTGGDAPVLTLGDAHLPLSDLLDLQISADSLPPLAQAPEAAPGTIASASDGRTMRIQIEGETDARRVRLLGVEPPAEGACMEHAAEQLLDDLVEQSVMVEEDSAVTGDNSLRYVWLVNEDGSRSLLNQRLIAEGRASAAPIPGDARFGLWLEVTEQDAEAGEIGLWAGCEEEEEEEATTPARTATATATVTPRATTPAPTPTREATAPADAVIPWSGDIEEIGTIRLALQGDALTSLSLSYELACPVSGEERTGGGRAALSSPVELVNGTFTVDVGIGSSQAITVTGLVLGESSIVGTVTVPVIEGCTEEEMQAQWSAEPA